jgi:hypothetical protein
LGASPLLNHSIAVAFGSRAWRAYSACAFSESKPAAWAPEVSQVTRSALRPCRVALTVSPSTATPKGSGITLVTPFTFMTSATFTLSGFAPSIGDSSTVAYTMPGRRTSMP